MMCDLAVLDVVYNRIGCKLFFGVLLCNLLTQMIVFIVYAIYIGQWLPNKQIIGTNVCLTWFQIQIVHEI